MIGEYFIDQSISATVSLQPKDSSSKDILENILYILKWYKKETPNDDFPIEFKDKYDLALYLAKYRNDHKKYDFAKMTQGMKLGKYRSFIPMLTNVKEKLEADKIKEMAKDVYQKRKLCELLKGKKDLIRKLGDIDTGMYSDDTEMIQEWESVIYQLNHQLQEVNKLETLEDVSSIDILNDDFSPVMYKLRDQSDSLLSLKTGYNFLQDSLPAKGFEPCRLYLIGGTSGVGKSSILVNFLGNAVNLSQPYDPFENKQREVLLYITCENLIDESIERLYCMLTKTSVEDVKKKYEDPTFTLKTDLERIMKRKSLNVIMVYAQPKKTTLNDIEILIDRIQSRGLKLKGLFLDYLDLIRSGYLIDNLRHELGEVSIGLKNLAVTYRIPVITVTQLNRGGYNASEEPSLTQMSESMQKIDNSDFVLFLQLDKEPVISIPTELGIPRQCKHIKMSILKNRNGPVSKSTLVVMQEKLGSQEIFNFRIEEKFRMDNSLSNNSPLDLTNDDSVFDIQTFNNTKQSNSINDSQEDILLL